MECNHCSRKDGFSDKSCISTVPIFSNLTEKEVLQVAGITISREYKKGENIYLAGEKSDRLYVIHIGKVKISRISESGKEQIIRLVGPGDFMGELSLFSSTILNSNAEVLEDTTICIIEGEKLRYIINQNPGIATKIIEELSMRLQNAENLIESLSLYDVEQRIADILLKMADDKDEIVLSMSRKDLAAHIAMSQETLSRKLSVFQEKGWINQTGHRKINILNRQKIEEISSF